MGGTRTKCRDGWFQLVEWAANNFWDKEEFVAKRRDRWTVVFLVYAALVLDNILLTVVVPIVPDYLYSLEHPDSRSLTLKILPRINSTLLGPATREHLPDSHIPEDIIEENGKVGLLFASKSLVQLLANPLVGGLTSQYGYSLPFTCGTAFLLLSSLMFSMSGSFTCLLAARAVHGVASAAISIAGMGSIALLFPDEAERARVMGHVLGGIALGVLIGYPYGGISYSILGPNLPFLLIAALALTLILAQAILFPRDMGGFDFGQPTGLAHLLKDRFILLVAASICSSTCAIAVLEPCLPIWLMDTIQPKKWQLGTVFLPDSLGYMLGTNCFAVISLRVGRYKVALLAQLLVGLCCCGITFAHSMLDLVLPHFGLGLGIGIIDSSLMPLLALLVESRHVAQYGSVYAIAQTAVALAYSLGPLSGGYLVQAIGFKALMRSLGFLNLIFCPVLLFLRTVDSSSSSESKTRVVGPHANPRCYNTQASPVQPPVDSLCPPSQVYTRLYESSDDEPLRE